MSHVTEKTLEWIAEQKIKALSEFISMRGEESEYPSDKEDIDIIEQALSILFREEVEDGIYRKTAERSVL